MTFPSATTRRTQHGFSLLELLVVLGILAVVVGGVLVVLQMIPGHTRLRATQTTLAKTAFVVEDWERDFEVLPPVEVARLHKVSGRGAAPGSVPNETNEGVETVWRAQFTPGYTGRGDFTAEERSNTDDDRVAAAPRELHEVRDGWGHPVVYIPHPAYVRAERTGLAYVNGAGEAVIARPHRQGDGTFARGRRFQVFSMGPDGVPNTPDDVLGWER